MLFGSDVHHSWPRRSYDLWDGITSSSPPFLFNFSSTEGSLAWVIFLSCLPLTIDSRTSRHLLTLCSHHHHLHLIIANIIFPPSPIESFARRLPNLLFHCPSCSTHPSALPSLHFGLCPCRTRVAMFGTVFFTTRYLTVAACMNGNGPPHRLVPSANTPLNRWITFCSLVLRSWLPGNRARRRLVLAQVLLKQKRLNKCSAIWALNVWFVLEYNKCIA